MTAYPIALRDFEPTDPTLRDNQLRLGLWMFLATVTMLFAAFTSAYIVRRSGSDWRHVALPPILWLNTLILAASSIAVEAANRYGRCRRWRASTAAFAHFQKDHADRREGGVDQQTATLVGAYITTIA